MPSKTVLRRGFKAEAERISENFRNQLGISKFDPLDAFRLAEYLGIPVISLDELDGFPEEHLSILRQPSKFSAIWMPNEEEDKIIIHNNHHSPKRQQSNIMHELSHIICNHEIPEETARLCFLLNLHYYNTEQEQEAKYLGSCLQITRAGLQWSLKRNYSEEKISDYYNASIEMVKFRLNTSGVLIQRSYYK
jgi:Zn-dependent peptidase ImmA (M78 family)